MRTREAAMEAASRPDLGSTSRGVRLFLRADEAGGVTEWPCLRERHFGIGDLPYAGCPHHLHRRLQYVAKAVDAPRAEVAAGHVERMWPASPDGFRLRPVMRLAARRPAERLDPGPDH